MQKKDPTYKDVKEDTAWNMDKFNEYINSHYSAQMGIEENWTFNTLTVSVMIRFRSPKKIYIARYHAYQERAVYTLL